MSLEELFEEFKSAYKTRGSVPGLLISLMKTLQKLGATGGRFASLDEFYEAHPLQKSNGGEGKRNAWAVVVDPSKPANKKKNTISIRPAYNDAERWFYEQRRYSYPSMAPHATQSWVDYTHWIEAILAFSDEQVNELDALVRAHVLAVLPEHKVDVSIVKREPPRFLFFLRDFDLSKHKKEMTGAAYQGAVFGYLRADASHLQVEVEKVRTGGKRVGKIGDIEARDGELLVLSAEVKQYVIQLNEVQDFAQFAHRVAEQGALGLVVALGFADGAREALEDLGVQPVSKADLIERVRLWDPLKQSIAIQALLYYVHHVERSPMLYNRLREFLDSVDEAEAIPLIETDAAPPTAAE